MRAKPVSEALLNAAAMNDLCHNYKRAEVSVIYGMNLQRAALRLNEGFTVRPNRPLKEFGGSASLDFSLTCGIAESRIVRLESFTNNWRDNACRSAPAGPA
jgi:hypothetical protein